MNKIFISVWHLRSCFWGALSDERTGLSFVYASGPCQRSLSRVRVPWDSRPYFTVSDLRLPFSSHPTTRRVTVEVLDPASTPVILSVLNVYIIYRTGERTLLSVTPKRFLFSPSFWTFSWFLTTVMWECVSLLNKSLFSFKYRHYFEVPCTFTCLAYKK
jgi:hypothetical protein